MKLKTVACKCIQKPWYETDELPAVAGLVEIESVLYTLMPKGNQSNQGFVLHNLRNGQVYEVETRTGKPICRCKASIYHDRYCKHCRALQQFRNQGIV